MELGQDLDMSIVENKIASQQPHQCALLIYTVSPMCQTIYCSTNFLRFFFLSSLAPLVHLKL